MSNVSSWRNGVSSSSSSRNTAMCYLLAELLSIITNISILLYHSNYLSYLKLILLSYIVVNYLSPSLRFVWASLSLSLSLSLLYIFISRCRHHLQPPRPAALIKSFTGVNVVLLVSELFIIEISEVMNQDIEDSPLGWNRRFYPETWPVLIKSKLMTQLRVEVSKMKTNHDNYYLFFSQQNWIRN